MGKLKTPDPLAGINRKVADWKEAYIAEVHALLDKEETGAEVKSAMTAAGVLFVDTPSGSPTLQPRAGATKFARASCAAALESLVRKYVDPKIIEAEAPKIETFTTVGAPSVALIAPQ